MKKIIVNNNMINSSIMDIGEFDMIKIAISERMKKEIDEKLQDIDLIPEEEETFDPHPQNLL